MPVPTSVAMSAKVRSEVRQMALKTCLAFLALGFAMVMPTSAQAPARESGREPVVVELFTSEGCSDCPPADALLEKLEQQQPIPGADIIPLEEHVDYWNHDGWIDPFSSMAWTDRQRNYVAMLSNGTPYSPEMVVDGQSQFVGSREREAEAAIERAARGPKTDVAISAGKLDGKDSQDFNVSVGKLVGNADDDVADVWIAVTEDGLRSSVTGGENAGHVLYHAAVLRLMHRIGVAQLNGTSTSFTGDPRVKFNSHWNHANLHAVVFVQEKKSHKILGAASITVEPGSVPKTSHE